MKKIVTAAALLLFSGVPLAQADDLAVGAKIGTLGLGAEVTTNVVPMMLNARIQGNVFNYNSTASINTLNGAPVHYNQKMNLMTVGLLADFYPFAGKFRITGGAYYNNNRATLTSTTNATINIGNTPVGPNTAITTKVKFKKLAPYVGIGWGDAVSSGSPLGFNFELGAVYQGSPKVSMFTSAQNVTPADLALEAQHTQDQLKKFKWWPVISFGVSLKF